MRVSQMNVLESTRGSLICFARCVIADHCFTFTVFKVGVLVRASEASLPVRFMHPLQLQTATRAMFTGFSQHGLHKLEINMPLRCLSPSHSHNDISNLPTPLKSIYARECLMVSLQQAHTNAVSSRCVTLAKTHKPTHSQARTRYAANACSSTRTPNALTLHSSFLSFSFSLFDSFNPWTKRAVGR